MDSCDINYDFVKFLAVLTVSCEDDATRGGGWFLHVNVKAQFLLLPLL
jgi:hypothetical protein